MGWISSCFRRILISWAALTLRGFLIVVDVWFYSIRDAVRRILRLPGGIFTSTGGIYNWLANSIPKAELPGISSLRRVAEFHTYFEPKWGVTPMNGSGSEFPLFLIPVEEGGNQLEQTAYWDQVKNRWNSGTVKCREGSFRTGKMWLLFYLQNVSLHFFGMPEINLFTGEFPDYLTSRSGSEVIPVWHTLPLMGPAPRMGGRFDYFLFGKRKWVCFTRERIFNECNLL